MRKIIALTLYSVVSVGQAATVTFTEGEFDIPPWESVAILGAIGGQTASHVDAGGNPDAFFSVTTNTNALTRTAHFNPGFVYDPSVQGAIGSIDVSLDFRNIIAFGEGHGVIALVVEQSGIFYGAAAFITESSDFDWQTFALAEITSSAFFALDDSDGAPDFTTAGAPLTFGFATQNEFGNTITVGYDNYAVTLHPVPVPAALPLLLSALGLGWLSTRRK